MTIPLHFTLWQESDASRPCLCFVNTLAALVVTKQHTWTFQTTPALTAPGNGLGCKLHNDQHFRKRESCPGEGYGLSVKAGSFLAEPPSPWAPCRGSTGPGVLLGGLFLRRGPAGADLHPGQVLGRSGRASPVSPLDSAPLSPSSQACHPRLGASPPEGLPPRKWCGRERATS